MRLGIFSNTMGIGTIEDVVSDAIAAEEQGFSTYWAPQIFGYDALTVLAILGRETEAIELGTSVVPTYPRHPSMLAGQALTTQEAAGGRLTLGIGLSHQPVVEGMWGLDFSKPLRHMREYLEILMPLLEGKSVSFTGETMRSNVTLTIRDPQPVPVLVAALGPQMLRLAAERTAGTVTWMTGPRTLESHVVPTLTDAAAAAANPAPRVACGLPICVTSDVDATRERAAQTYAIYGQLPSYRAMLDREGADGPADIAIVGDEDEVAARVRALADIGVTDFVASEFGTSQDEISRTRDLLRTLLG